MQAFARDQIIATRVASEEDRIGDKSTSWQAGD